MHGTFEDGPEGIRAEIRAGLRDIAAPAVAAVPIGLLFGAVAAGKGLSVLEVALMSGLVFAGGAQFAAIEIWTVPVPVAVLVVSTLLINLRHVLMGASLAGRLGRFSRGQKLAQLALMADENWAFAERRAARQTLTPAYFGAMGAAFWVNWLVWCILGALAGSVLGDPRRLGADFAFTALFIGLVASFWRGRSSAVVIGASAVVAAVVHGLAGPPWHVAAGALAGILAAVLVAPSPEAGR
ncbi:AzlC family ABC transporter permease [Methylobacterium sp. ID0610]|uniref:AzlC family ABC transporter permease n=1 Tax=Methylobacterium carpenticola TaxID=3344827 RepID=UPI00368A3075